MSLSERSLADEQLGPHPEAERLAEYADGVLKGPGRVALERHLADCATCRDTLMETLAFTASEPNPVRLETRSMPMMVFPSPRRWLGAAGGLAAAALLLIVAGGLVIALLPDRSGGRIETEWQTLVAAAAHEPTRPVEGRLTGGFAYAPPPTTRGATDREPSPDVRIAAARIQALARDQRTPANDAALGIAHLLLGEVENAVAVLARAADTQGTSSLNSDLAAAYLASGATRREDLVKARAAAERALAGGDAPVEAWFNLALALEHLGLREEAVKAWQEYLRRDNSSPWATEARRYAQGTASP